MSAVQDADPRGFATAAANLEQDHAAAAEVSACEPT